MTVRFFITEDEVRAFFEGCGYTCRMVEVPRWRQTSHGTGTMDMIPEMHVDVSGQTFRADNLIDETIKARLMSTDLAAKLAIKKAAITLKQLKIQ